jgi:hypothetical protein
MKKICQKEYIAIQSQHATLIRKEEQHNIMVCVEKKETLTPNHLMQPFHFNLTWDGRFTVWSGKFMCSSFQGMVWQLRDYGVAFLLHSVRGHQAISK